MPFSRVLHFFGRGRFAQPVIRWLPAIGLLAWACWLSAEFFLFGRHSYIRQHDAAEANTAFYIALPDLSQRGLLGYWHPLAGAGVDGLANLKGDIPAVEALFRVAPHWSNSGALLLAQAFVAGLGTFVILRRRLGISRWSAILAAAWFAYFPAANPTYSGFATWHGWYVPAFPVVLLLLGWGARQTLRVAVPAAIVTGAVLALGTPAASGVLVLPAVLLWMFAIDTAPARRRIVIVASAFSLALLIVKAPTIIALLGAVPDSHRVIRSGLPFGVADEAGFREVWRMSAADLVRDHRWLLGVALTGWLAGGFRRRSMNMTMAVTAAVILVTLQVPVIRALPGLFGLAFNTYQIDRIARFLPFAVVAAAALGLDQFRSVAATSTSRMSKVLANTMFVGASALLAAVLAMAAIETNLGREYERLTGSHYASLFDQQALKALADERRANDPFRVATFANGNVSRRGYHPGFAWAYGLETADAYLNVYPLRYHAFWSRVIAPTLDRRPDIRQYFSTWGNRAYLFNPAAPLFDPLPKTSNRTLEPLPFNLNLLSLANVRYILSQVALHDDRLRLRPDSKGAPDDRPMFSIRVPPRSVLPVLTMPVFVYENPAALPRFFVVYDWRRFSDSGRLLDAMAAADGAALGSTAFLDEATAEKLDAARNGAAPSAAPGVIVNLFSADRIELGVTTTAPGLLVIGNSYSRYWQAQVEGMPAEVLPVNHAFQGVAIGAGAQSVVLTYRPPHAVGGAKQPYLVVAALGLVGAVTLFVGAKIDRHA